ncbi:MAG: TlpA family protein disulfide reductase [Candidatus Rokubacteria bacterium]|nr:TlpA family protein disulfide reductase [Candidatus Rokubacteria bacterium]
MEALWKTRQREGLRIIGVNLSEPAERVKSYVAKMKLTFPVVIDASGEVARSYGVRFTPTHFLVDRAGVVRAGGSGSNDWNSAPAHAAVRILLGANSHEPTIAPARRDRASTFPNTTIERR